MDKDLAEMMIVGVVLLCVTTILPLCIIYLKRGDRTKSQHQLPVPEIVARLERMELGMESMSAEIERIGEGQRYTTKLLQTNSEHPERLPRRNT